MKKALLFGIACFMLATASAETFGHIDYTASKDVVEVHEVHKEQRIVVHRIQRDSTGYNVPDGWHVAKMSVDTAYDFVIVVLEKN